MLSGGKKMRLSSVIAAIGLVATAAVAQEKLTVFSWGGVYETAQKKAIFEPFTRQTGIEIDSKIYFGSMETLRRRAEREGWDVVDMIEDRAISACQEGLIQPLDIDRIVVADPFLPVSEDFSENAFRECSVAQNVFATVIGYNDQKFPGVKPSRIEDFFDLENFPGRRSIQKSPDAILEWALMAEGVPPSQVYDLLSTDRGLDLAFRKLDSLRGNIVWWKGAGSPSRLLVSGVVSMASGYNGRFFSASNDKGQPITVVWDGRLIGIDVWAVNAKSSRPELAEKFLAFATMPEQMASLAEIIPYGPTRQTGRMRVGLGSTTNVHMSDHLPNAPHHGGRILAQDSVWYSRTKELRERRFQEWLEETGQL